MTLVTAPDRDELRRSVVDAAAQILRRDGAQAVTTRGVAQAAGVPAPTLFRLFGDKDGLMDAVAEHVMNTYMAAKAHQATGENGDPVEDLRTGWRTHIEFSLANPDLAVLLATPGPLQASHAVQVGAEVLRARVRRVAASGRLTVSQDRAVDMIRSAGTGAVLVLLSRPEQERDLGLAETMLEGVLGRILTPENASSPATDVAALTVAFAAAVPDLPTLTDSERNLLAEWTGRIVAHLQGD